MPVRRFLPFIALFIAGCDCGGAPLQHVMDAGCVVETCNGLDDDCDGVVDNIGTTSCGVGACERTVQLCSAGELQTCTPGGPTVEVCDDVDNDCDGQTNEDGVCDSNHGPIAICYGAQSGSIGVPVQLSATAFATSGTIVWTRWSVVIRPLGSTAQPEPVDQPEITFTPDVGGSYTLAYCVRDDGNVTTCCSISLSVNGCATPPSPPVSTTCATSWDGRPIIQFDPVPDGLTYQLTQPGDSQVLAQADAGSNYLRAPVRIAPGGPPPGADIGLEVRACTAGSDTVCCSNPTPVHVKVVEACSAAVTPTSANLVLSEYVVDGEGACPNSSTCQAGEAVELTNLSNCPLALNGFHFAYRNAAGSSSSVRWMNFGTADVIPPRGVYVAMRGQQYAHSCAASLSATPESPGLFGLNISTLVMQGANLSSGWFNNAGGGVSVMQVSQGHVTNSAQLNFHLPITEVEPYQSSNQICAGTGFDALNSCGDFPSTQPTTVLRPNQLGRLWHPCDAVAHPVPDCVRD